MVRRGDPPLTIRLEPHVLQKLREVAGEAKGKFGGAAHYVRQLIYADLGLGAPPTTTEHLSKRSGRRKSSSPEEPVVEAYATQLGHTRSKRPPPPARDPEADRKGSAPTPKRPPPPRRLRP